MDDAREAFERVIELFERNPSAHGTTVTNLPVPYSYVGFVRAIVEANAKLALEVANRGLARFPDNADLWYHAAYAHIGLGDLDSARSYSARARDTKVTGYGLISMQDRSIPEWRAAKLVADIDFEREEARAAYGGYVAVFERVPDIETRIVIAARLVELAPAIGEIDALAGHTLAYLTLKPAAWEVAIQVAQAIAAHRGLQAAYDLLTQIYDQIEAVREHVGIPLAVGSIAEQAGEDAEALRWYEVVAERGHRDPRFWANLGKLLLRLGAHEEAAQALKAAEDLLAGTTE